MFGYFSYDCSVQSLDLLGRGGDMTGNSAEILFQSFPLKAIAGVQNEHEG